VQADSSRKSSLLKKKQKGQGERQVRIAWHGTFRKKVREKCFRKGGSLQVEEARQRAVENRAVRWLLWKVGSAKVDGEAAW